MFTALNTEEKFKYICDLLLKAKARQPRPWIVAFDADGTLWNTDLGEIFFEYQIQNSNLKLPQDPWRHYLDTKTHDAPSAYLWLAQINQGVELAQVQAWAEAAFVEKSPFPIFDFQKRLIAFLHSESFEVYIVTASIKWAVEPGGKRLGVPPANVLGVKTKIENGVVSHKQDGPITYRKGKADALLEATKGVRPIFCAGNTLGDLHLLETATDLAVAILSQKPGEHLYGTEQELQFEAQHRNWLCLNLGSDF